MDVGAVISVHASVCCKVRGEADCRSAGDVDADCGV